MWAQFMKTTPPVDEDREEADPPLHRLGSARPILLETVEEELMLELDEALVESWSVLVCY